VSRTRAAVVTLALAVSGCTGAPESGSLDTLAGWRAADHAAALAVWARHCARLGQRCPDAADRAAPRRFWERHFVAPPGAAARSALVTGYHEPVLAASPRRSAAYTVPLHAMPADPRAREATRGAIMDGALAGRARVLYWLADPVEAFFLHVQGSGRLELPDGQVVRVGYAGRNAHPYRSIGRLAVERGLLPGAGMTADRLKAWLRANPAAGRALMAENPSYIFFREVAGLAPDAGPVGAAGVPLTPGVSAALDPAVYPPGSPVWIDAEGPGGPVRRLAIAEDAGAAITGPARADLFLGTGAAAGRRAGALVARGAILPLVPRAEAGR